MVDKTTSLLLLFHVSCNAITIQHPPSQKLGYDHQMKATPTLGQIQQQSRPDSVLSKSPNPTKNFNELPAELVNYDNVVVVQGFNHEPPKGNAEFIRNIFKSGSTLASEWNSAALNFHYAQKHGYAHRLYMYGKEAACPHDRLGKISQPQWCKVLALITAMGDFPNASLFVWLDNDVAVRNMTISIADILKDAPIGLSGGTSNHCQIGPLDQAFSIAAWQNTHWGCGPETGSLIIKRSDVAQKLLSDWWDMADKRGPGPYDQGPFVNMYESNKGQIAVIGDDTFNNNPAQLLLHRCGSCNWLPSRDDMMHQIERENNIEDISGTFKQMLGNSVDFKIRDSIH